MSTYTQEEAREIAKAAFQIVKTQNWNAGLPIRFDSFYIDADLDMPTVIITNKTSSYEYKFYIRYNPGTDEYDTRFGKMFCSNSLKSLDRDDWYVQMVTEWSCGLPLENLFLSLECDYNDRNKLDYHKLEDEVKAKSEEPETNEYEEMLKAAGWI